MRNIPSLAVLAVFGLVAAVGTASADDNVVAGAYDVKYEEMSNNCTNVGMTLGRGVLKVELKGSTLVVDIERIPLMNGVPAKGKITARSKVGPTSIQGLDGTFSVAGRAGSDGFLQLVFVAEYQVKGKPLCTQSWNISGVKQSSSKPK